MSRGCLSIDSKCRIPKSSGRRSGSLRRPKEVEMNAVFGGCDLSVRPAVAVFLGLVATAFVGGYLIGT